MGVLLTTKLTKEIEGHEETKYCEFFFVVFDPLRDLRGYGLAVKLKETPPEMARLVLFDSSGLEIVRPMPT